MQRLPDGTLRFSPRDLIAWLEGDFAAWCERLHVERGPGGMAPDYFPNVQPNGADAELELAARRGDAHETAWLDQLRVKFPDLVALDKSSPDSATIDAMKRGVSVIYQAHLNTDNWQGYPDFLHRVPGASNLGDYHYEPWDTKLARSAKPYFMLQLAAYADQLETMQGKRPDHFGFVFGQGERVRYLTADYYHYYTQLRRTFLSFQDNWSPDHLPDPGADRSHGRWGHAAAALLDALDDLSRVAGITRQQMTRLQEAGIKTFTQLATTELDAIPRMSSNTWHQLKRQATLQHRTTQQGAIAYELRRTDPADPRRGLALLPPPSANDVFFDMEGFPYAENGLEYLFGAVHLVNGVPHFADWWAHNAVEEQRAFEGFIDWAYQRWLDDSTMHIYHYAGYERTTLGRLMGRFATREFEFDQLLRHGVLVDLLPVVRQGMVIGTPSYSLKDVEHLYMPARTEEITSAGGSVVEYQRWLDSGESPDYTQSPLLNAIREYNRVDCESTWRLRDWLLERQNKAGVAWLPPPSREKADGEASDPTQREITPAEKLATELLTRADAMAEGDDQRITRLLAWLLEFHRREMKPMWWRRFEREGMTEEELYDDFDCLAGLVRTETPAYPEARSMVHEFSYDTDQDTKLHQGSKCVLVQGGFGVVIHGLDAARGLVEIKVSKRELPAGFSLIPDEHISPKPIQEALFRLIQSWATGVALPSAIDDLLRRNPPRVAGQTPGAPLTTDSTQLPELIALAENLENSTLCIQGPPGTGKTTTGAAIIAALVASGKRVGVVANSHAVIMNLLGAAKESLRALGSEAAVFKAGGEKTDPLIADGSVRYIEPSNILWSVQSSPMIVGGTAWTFVRPDMAGQLDYLFVDEAGQFSLANTIAAGIAAKNLILLGDQMQLAQPLQGTHPPESGLSCLEYLLQDHATIPATLGVFLGTSYRMHPEICGAISDFFYEGRLTSVARTANNRLILPADSPLKQSVGIAIELIDHRTRGQDSPEEVARIVALVGALLQSEVCIGNAPPRALELKDILLVAPFNAQVRALAAALPAGARVGSVDRFQGQQAPVVIVSMCASTLDDAPRGAEFLLSPNRLNVALSRAQALAIVVGSAHLADTRVRSVAEMRLVNRWAGLTAGRG